MRDIEFWLEFASPYSYLSAERIVSLAAERNISVHWKPFLLGPIFKSQGWNDSPFNIYPAKGAYMWVDVERECAHYGLEFQRPNQFPRNGLLATRIAFSNSEEPWLPDFIRAVFRSNFVLNQNIASSAVISDCLRHCGLEPERFLAEAALEQTKLGVRRQNEHAQSIGIFGAPMFRVKDGLYWGNDRLLRALDAV